MNYEIIRNIWIFPVRTCICDSRGGTRNKIQRYNIVCSLPSSPAPQLSSTGLYLTWNLSSQAKTPSASTICSNISTSTRGSLYALYKNPSPFTKLSAHLDTADLSFINDCKCDHIKHDMKHGIRYTEQERVTCRRIVLLANPNIFVLCRASDMKIIPPALLIKTSNNCERGQTVERV